MASPSQEIGKISARPAGSKPRRASKSRPRAESYRQLFDGSPLPMWIIDIETLRFLDVNATACRAYGYSRGEFLAMTLHDIRPPDDVPAMEWWLQTSDPHVVATAIWRHRRKDGSVFFAEVASHEAPYQGRAARYACAIDVTKRIRDEQRIRRLSQAIEQSPAATAITDIEGRIQYVNAKFIEVSGYSSEELIGQNPRVIKSGLTPPAVYENLWKTIKSGSDWRGVIRNRKKSGELYWECEVISPVKNERGEVIEFIAVKEDITARMEAEQALCELNADLEQRVAERTAELEAANRELEAFDYSLAHDLRSPLARIRGFGAALLKDSGDKLDPEGIDHLRRIIRSAESMDELVGDLLRLSTTSRQELSPRDVDVSARALFAFEALRKAQPERQVELVLAPGLRARADPGLLAVVLENLIGNAWKFTSRRERARIEVGETRLDGRQALFVRDNGAGFDSAYADKLFGPFQRLHTKDEFPGTGIGLATVKRILLRHGGTIWAEGAVGQGATFYFTLSP